MVFAVLTYPAMVHHLLGGYRGTGATGSMFALDNTVMRLSFFCGLLNDFVFGKGLILIAAIFIGGVMLVLSKHQKELKFTPEAVILTAGTAGYFFLTTKAALLVGSASNRYEMPIYGLVILLIFWAVYYVADRIGNKMFTAAITMVILVFLIKGHIFGGNVLFLYKEDVAKIDYARENKENVAIVMFNPATPHNVWRLTDELLQYDRVFYMNEENLDKITEPDVVNADKIVLYVADNDHKEDALKNITDSCGKVENMTQIDSEDMWTTYEAQ